MNRPIASFVIASYNAADTIFETINSLKFCGCSDYEVIVVDDGSSDDTHAITLKAVQGLRHTVVKLAQNLGAATATNFAMSLANGRYLARIDADDICSTDRLLHQITHLEKNKEFMYCGGSLRYFGLKKGVMKYPKGIAACVGTLPAHCCYAHPAVTFDRERMSHQIYYDPRYAVAYDYDLWGRLCAQRVFGDNVDHECVEYRTHDRQLTQVLNRSLHADGMIIRQRLLSTMLMPDDALSSIVFALHLSLNFHESNLEFTYAFLDTLERAKPIYEFAAAWEYTKHFLKDNFEHRDVEGIRQRSVRDLTSFAVARFSLLTRKT